MSVPPDGTSKLAQLGPKFEALRGWRRQLPALLPDRAVLEDAFSRSVSGSWPGSTIMEREPAPHASTFPGELLTCQMTDGSQRLVLSKYSTQNSHSAEGRGRGLAYEAFVYRDLLSQSELRCPELFGYYQHPVSGEIWLFIEYVANAVRLDETPRPWESVTSAVEWAARFHAERAERLNVAPPDLRAYDEAYYLRWSDRVAGFAQGDDLAWLRKVCEIFERHIAVLTDASQTVIHGEFTVHNVLCTGSSICPVDWESAAIAPGLIDLASLTEGWPEELAVRCETQYKSMRWPNGASKDFAFLLDVARVYWNLRWLGHKIEMISSKKGQQRQLRLQKVVERLGWNCY